METLYDKFEAYKRSLPTSDELTKTIALQSYVDGMTAMLQMFSWIGQQPEASHSALVQQVALERDFISLQQSREVDRVVKESAAKRSADEVIRQAKSN